MDDAARFRLEIMFSSGAQHNPYHFRPAQHHTMSISPRESLHKGALLPAAACLAALTCTDIELLLNFCCCAVQGAACCGTSWSSCWRRWGRTPRWQPT